MWGVGVLSFCMFGVVGCWGFGTLGCCVLYLMNLFVCDVMVFLIFLGGCGIVLLWTLAMLVFWDCEIFKVCDILGLLGFWIL